MKSTKTSSGRATPKGAPQVFGVAPRPSANRASPPSSYVDPDNFAAAVQVLLRAREELLTAADRADFAARKAGTPIRTQDVRVKIEALSAEVRRIERIIMDSAAEEFQNRGSQGGQLAQSIGTIKRGRRADLVYGDEEGSDVEGCFPLNPRSARLRGLQDVFGRSQWARATRENVGYARGLNRRGLTTGMDLVFTAKRTPAAPKQAPLKGGSSSGKEARDWLLKMSPADIAKFTVAELSKMLADITSLGSFDITEKDFQVLVLIIDALKVALRGDSNAAAKVLDEFGAKNMEILLSNIRQRLLFDTAYYSPEDRKLADHMLEEFSLLVRQALQSPGYYENEHALQTFLRDNPITVSILLLQPSTPPPSSKLLALLAGRILPDPGASRILNLKSSPGKTARMLLLDALETDQKNGGDSVERYLFDNLSNPFWPSPDIRQNALLISHKFPSVGDVRGDVNDERTADMFHAAVVERFNSNKRDVLDLFKSAVEGKFSNSGASFTEEGQFAMAHILSMLMNEQSMLQQGKDVPVSYATHFENFILNGGNYNLQNLDFRKFIGFVGSIGQSRLAGAEIMIGLNSYLASKGGASLLSNPVAPASVIGVLVDAIRDETARRNGNNNAIVEFLVGAALVAGAAAFAPEALAAAATAGLVLSEVQKRAAVEVSKNMARQVAKNASKALAPSTQDLQSLRSQMQVLYSLNIFSTLSDQMKTEMLNDPKIKPFVVGSAIQPPLVGSFALFEGKRREVTENDRQQFGFRITYYISPTNSSVLAFSNAFINQFVG
jgi:hypothetical protein